ncbi:MAG: hypothetical protein SGARI_003232 [Bacillariaceae sp.]
MLSRISFYFFLVLVLLNAATQIISPVDAATEKDPANNPRVPINVLQKAIQYVTETVIDNEERLKQLKELNDGNVHTLYEVAKAMNANSNDDKNKKSAANDDNKIASMEIWHALADAGNDDNGHILSQVALGFAYAANDKPRAIAYFVAAGEAGPHQSALYNAGRLLAETEDFVKALAYLRAAYSVAETHPKYATEHLTETSRYAYEQLSGQLVALIQDSLRTKGSVLSIQQVADMFLYANIKDFPPPSSKGEKTWQGAMEALQSERWELALVQLEKLEKQFGSELSQLQMALLYVLQEYRGR